jgi:hypothetical protein
MLKKMYFTGTLILDVTQLSTLEHEYYLQQYINSDGLGNVEISIVDIKKLSDIPKEWLDSIPEGDREVKKLPDRTCEEIFTLEMLPHLPVSDPNQIKFEFFHDQNKLQKTIK